MNTNTFTCRTCSATFVSRPALKSHLTQSKHRTSRRRGRRGRREGNLLLNAFSTKEQRRSERKSRKSATSMKLDVAPKKKEKKSDRDGVIDSSRDLEAMKYHQQALNRFLVTPRPPGIPAEISPPPRVITLQCTLTEGVPVDVQKRAAMIVRHRGEFSREPIHSETDKRIKQFVSETTMTWAQAISLRSQFQSQRALFSFGNVIKNVSALLKAYSQGCGVIELSNRFDAPPYQLLRAIFKERGAGKSSIRQAFIYPSGKKWSEFDIHQIKLAKVLDTCSGPDMTIQQKKATEFEDKLKEKLKSLRVKFLDEIQMRSNYEKSKKENKSQKTHLLTPDMLLLDDVRINGVPISWIDAKCYYISRDVKSTFSRIKKMIKKYRERFGHGLVVLKEGFCENVDCPGATFIHANDFFDLHVANEAKRDAE
mmetsp:Transcript_14707/g.23961  ORF Transcript_14707/g.23961 Transcript_14707/m.23961 type:complete len:424 (-) Transcript_14707:160-1431(-)